MIQVSRLILYLNNHDTTLIYKIDKSYDNYFAIVKKYLNQKQLFEYLK